MSSNPLGQSTDFPKEYAPEALFSIPRSDGRATLGIGADVPFRGVDIWNAWELTWLDAGGKPAAGTARLRIDAGSPYIVESKSLKLYLGSLAMTRFDSAMDVMQTISRDIESVVGAQIDVAIATSYTEHARTIDKLPGDNIDREPMKQRSETVDPGLLSASGATVTEKLNTHLLRSLCPVTGQPDIGSVMIHYQGPQIDRSSLLGYIVSFRQHQDFHEACIERMFLDIKKQCGAEQLSVFGCYTRRGGIDINPFRTDFNDDPPTGRFWRQ